jgi:hypothetical protein
MRVLNWDLADGGLVRVGIPSCVPKSNVNSVTTSQLCLIGMSYQATNDGQTATGSQKKKTSCAGSSDGAGAFKYMTATAETGAIETCQLGL